MPTVAVMLPPPVTVIVVVAPLPARGVTTNVSGGDVGATVATPVLLLTAVKLPAKFCCEALKVMGVRAHVKVRLVGLTTTWPKGALDEALQAMTAAAAGSAAMQATAVINRRENPAPSFIATRSPTNDARRA